MLNPKQINQEKSSTAEHWGRPTQSRAAAPAASALRTPCAPPGPALL